MSRPSTLAAAKANPRYWNKIAVETSEGVFSTNSSDRAVELFKKFERKYPDSPPVLGFIPPGNSIMIPTYLQHSPTQPAAAPKSKKKA